MTTIVAKTPAEPVNRKDGYAFNTLGFISISVLVIVFAYGLFAAELAASMFFLPPSDRLSAGILFGVAVVVMAVVVLASFWLRTRMHDAVWAAGHLPVLMLFSGKSTLDAFANDTTLGTAMLAIHALILLVMGGALFIFFLETCLHGEAA